MITTTSRALLLAATLLPFGQLQAHGTWLLPSSTVLSAPQWITVDAAVSNDAFLFNHNALAIDNLQISGPDGQPVTTENALKGKLRSVIDVNLAQPGSYRLSLVNQGANARYTLNGEQKRWRGKAADIATAIPADATDLEITESFNRIETFATVGSPTLLKPAGKGLELVPVTHPNDLVAGEVATFRFLLDGKPARELKVTLVPGNRRYRDQQQELVLTTDKKGEIQVTWPHAGMYWLDADAEDGKTSIKQAKLRRLAYVATLEVLP